jgi:hypothetical protein
MDLDLWGPVVNRFLHEMAAYDFSGGRLKVGHNARFFGGQVARWIHQEFPEHVCALAIEVKKIFMDEWTGPETTRHLKQMLENGAARYLFPLDADHAHLAVPTELWAETYSKLSIGEVLPALLREPKLIALYHTAEHLTIADPTNVAASDATAKWRAKRNVLGFFDGRPLKILPPRPDGAAHDKPERYENVGNVYFLGHWLGEIAFSANGKAVSFDMSFNEDSSDAP